MLAWFTLSLEKRSHVLDNFDELIKEFQACFGDIDSVRTVINTIQRLPMHATSHGMNRP